MEWGRRMLKHPRVKTWVMGRGLKPHLFQDGGDLVEPMMWATAEPIQGLLEKPIFVTRVGGIPDRGPDDRELVIRKICLAEGIFAIPLLENALGADGLRCE